MLAHNNLDSLLRTFLGSYITLNISFTFEITSWKFTNQYLNIIDVLNSFLIRNSSSDYKTMYCQQLLFGVYYFSVSS